MMDDLDAVVTGGERKRGRTGEDGRGTSSGADKATVAGETAKGMLGDLPTTLGTGEHERSIMECILVALRDLSMDVQDLKGALYQSWELERDSPYISEGVKMKEQYSEDCRKIRGQGISLGHQQNYCMLGLYVAAKEDKSITDDHKT